MGLTASNSSLQMVRNEIPEDRKIVSVYPRSIRGLFFVFALYLVMPIVDIPVLGLSLSAPLFFVIALFCLLKPPKPWFHQYQGWILSAITIWGGVFISTAGNGLLSGGVAINSEGILAVVRYAFWLLVFVITAHFASNMNVMQRLAKLFGWGVFLLCLLRLGEAVFYDKIGAWVGTILLSQNDYGFLFSIFSPFLLISLLQGKSRRIFWVLIANVLLWGAVVINGSRGSWIAIAIGWVIALVLLVKAHPRKFSCLLFGILLVGSTLFLLIISAASLSETVLNRFDTFQRLETDKSYLIRKLMNQKAIALFKESPIIGVGAARFRLSTVPLEIPQALRYASQAHFDRKSAHNSYLGFLAESGLISAIPFGILLAVLIIQGFKAQAYFVQQADYWALAVFVGFLQMSIHMWAIYSLANTVSWFVYGLVAAMIMSHRFHRAE